MPDLAHQQRACNVADAVCSREIQFQRACGADWIEAYTRGWAVWDEVYHFVIYHRQDYVPETTITRHP
jgi:hypothetical protein